MRILGLINRWGPGYRGHVGMSLVPNKGQSVCQQLPEGRNVHHDIHLCMRLNALLSAAMLWRPVGDPVGGNGVTHS